jgi:hypothetical protein
MGRTVNNESRETAVDITVALTVDARFRAKVAANIAMALACEHDKPQTLLNPMLSTLARLGVGGVRMCPDCGAVAFGDSKGWLESSVIRAFRLIVETK